MMFISVFCFLPAVAQVLEDTPCPKYQHKNEEGECVYNICKFSKEVLDMVAWENEGIEGATTHWVSEKAAPDTFTAGDDSKQSIKCAEGYTGHPTIKCYTHDQGYKIEGACIEIGQMAEATDLDAETIKNINRGDLGNSIEDSSETRLL